MKKKCLNSITLHIKIYTWCLISYINLWLTFFYNFNYIIILQYWCKYKYCGRWKWRRNYWKKKKAERGIVEGYYSLINNYNNLYKYNPN